MRVVQYKILAAVGCWVMVLAGMPVMEVSA